MLCRRRVHDTARAVAVHVNRAPSTEVARHRVPLRYTVRAAGCCRAMPTNAYLTLICAGAPQEPSQPILRCAETATQANAGRRAPPDATECHRVHTSARHRAPPSVSLRDAACRLPPATAFHRVPLSATVRCKAPPSATIRATTRRRVLPSAERPSALPSELLLPLVALPSTPTSSSRPASMPPSILPP